MRKGFISLASSLPVAVNISSFLVAWIMMLCMTNSKRHGKFLQHMGAGEGQLGKNSAGDDKGERGAES